MVCGALRSEFIKLEIESDFSVWVKMTMINHTTLFCNWEREKTFILFLKTIHLIVSPEGNSGPELDPVNDESQTVGLLIFHSLCDVAY